MEILQSAYFSDQFTPMFFAYDLLVALAGFGLRIAALFSPKLRLFTSGRKQVFETLSAAISASDQTIWFHAASLGEYEQGLPVMEKIREKFPAHKIVLTFFSPSGFEVRKNNKIADVTVYLPLDSRSNARRFVDAVHPQMVFFIKYEFWPNYLKALRENRIPTYLISGIFRTGQPFFKWYGGIFRKSLLAFNHFFVQNASSKELLLKLGLHNVTLSGDTRFDRVAEILAKDNTLEFIARFKSGVPTIVVGSSWPKDELLVVDYINRSEGVKFIIAPHNIKNDQVALLRQSIKKLVVTYSEMNVHKLEDFDVFIVDTIGILTRIYSYADIAYVGGGFGNPGVHNILEPATFGIPVVIGPNYSHFAEATALVQMGGCISVKDQGELNDAFDNLLQNEVVRAEKGSICTIFVQVNTNATQIIMKHISHESDI